MLPPMTVRTKRGSVLNGVITAEGQSPLMMNFKVRRAIGISEKRSRLPAHSQTPFAL